MHTSLPDLTGLRSNRAFFMFFLRILREKLDKSVRLCDDTFVSTYGRDFARKEAFLHENEL